MKKLCFFLMVIAISSCTKKTNPPAEQKTSENQSVMEEKKCDNGCEGDHTKACGDLIAGYDKCNVGMTSEECGEFLMNFKESLPKNIACEDTCRNSKYTWSLSLVCSEFYDQAPHPKIFERSAYLLKKLNFKEAEELVLSQDFKSSLDGAIASSLLPHIERLTAIKAGVDLKTIYKEEIEALDKLVV